LRGDTPLRDRLAGKAAHGQDGGGGLGQRAVPGSDEHAHGFDRHRALHPCCRGAQGGFGADPAAVD
jgi:hypothetical protein